MNIKTKDEFLRTLLRPLSFGVNYDVDPDDIDGEDCRYMTYAVLSSCGWNHLEIDLLVLLDFSVPVHCDGVFAYHDEKILEETILRDFIIGQLLYYVPFVNNLAGTEYSITKEDIKEYLVKWDVRWNGNAASRKCFFI